MSIISKIQEREEDFTNSFVKLSPILKNEGFISDSYNSVQKVRYHINQTIVEVLLEVRRGIQERIDMLKDQANDLEKRKATFAGLDYEAFRSQVCQLEYVLSLLSLKQDGVIDK